MNAIITPIIHSNGDRKETLVNNLHEAHRAVRAAKNALRACAPHARNYYLIPGLFDHAMRQHMERTDHVYAVMQSLCDEAKAIQSA